MNDWNTALHKHYEQKGYSPLEAQGKARSTREAVEVVQAASPYSTVSLPDGIVIGGPWPHTIVSWPNGKSRGATKPEYDLFQALEKAHAEIEAMRARII